MNHELTMEQRHLERGHRYQTAVRIVGKMLDDARPMMQGRDGKSRAQDVVTLLEFTAKRLDRLHISAEGAISGVSFKENAE